MNKRGRILTRIQVLAWRDAWSHTDKQAISQSLDLLPTDRVEYYEEPDRGRLIVTVDGQKAFIIRPGFVSWPKSTWADGVDASLFATGLRVGGEDDGTTWAELSTFRDRNRTKKRAARDYGTCPSHMMTLPATGICDRC